VDTESKYLDLARQKLAIQKLERLGCPIASPRKRKAAGRESGLVAMVTC
jgi:hypothetical protein